MEEGEGFIPRKNKKCLSLKKENDAWNDKIDPNSTCWSDVLLSSPIGIFYDPKDYDLAVSWNQSFSSVVVKDAHVDQARFYPFPD